jgi:hypothetical protein
MSFFSNIVSTFEDLFNLNSTEQHSLDDHSSTILSTELSDTNYKFFTTITIGYINHRFKIKDTGCFIIMITSQNKSGPNAIYCISRSDKSLHGNIKELIKTKGINDESIELEWNPYEHPLLKMSLRPIDCKYNTINFLIKITSNF